MTENVENVVYCIYLFTSFWLWPINANVKMCVIRGQAAIVSLPFLLCLYTFIHTHTPMEAELPYLLVSHWGKIQRHRDMQEPGLAVPALWSVDIHLHRLSQRFGFIIVHCLTEGALRFLSRQAESGRAVRAERRMNAATYVEILEGNPLQRCSQP